MLKILIAILFSATVAFAGMVPVPVDCEKLAERILSMENRPNGKMPGKKLIAEFEMIAFDVITLNQIEKIKNKNIQFKAKVEFFKTYLESGKRNSFFKDDGFVCRDSISE